MDIIRDPHQFQQTTLAWRAAGLEVGFVPTMGALHAGHYRLVEEARRRTDRVCVSIFVNPSQFGPHEDLQKYPRPFERDLEGLHCRQVDAVFAPDPRAMYPSGFQTWVTVDDLSRPLCGAFRPGHFRGVTTVVLKLFMLAHPTQAFFGWKDAQQLIVIERMTRDLALPVRIVGVETVREPDGLAMSSRNAYLSPREREAAPLIYRALQELRAAVDAGERNSAALLARLRQRLGESELIDLEYAEIRDLESLAPLERIVDHRTLVAVAVRMLSARLIDNIRL